MTRQGLSRLLACLALAALPASAQVFTTTNVQLLHGTRFTDRFFGNHTTDKVMSTVTLENYTAHGLGDVFGFVDFSNGKMADFGGARDHQKDWRWYGEIAPRLSLSKLTGKSMSFGIVKDVTLSAQWNQGNYSEFWAWMVGAGVDLQIPGFQVLGVNAYSRKDKFNKSTYQVTTNWFSALGDTGLALEGFIDVYGTDTLGTEVVTQPQLTYDLTRHFSLPAKTRLKVGTEFYYHRNDAMVVQCPQVLVKAVW